MRFGALLKALRIECRMTQVQLASKLAVPQTLVSKWETGGIQSPGRDTLQRIAAALGVPVERLMSDEPTAPIAGSVLPGPILDAFVPVYAHCRAGLGDNGVPVAGKVIGTLPAPRCDADAGVFAIQVAGDSMAPKVEPGDYVLLWPANGGAPPDGTICLVCVEGWSECVLKVVRHGANGKVLLCSLNPAVPTVEVDPSQTGVRIVGIYRGLVRLDRPLKP